MVAHSEILLTKCAQFREQGEFIDVYLKVGEEFLSSSHRARCPVAIISTPCLLME